MILDNAAAYKVITERPNRKWIDSAQKYTQKLMMHIQGIGLDKYIEKVEAFEKQDLIAIRKKYAVSNQAIFARIHRPMDNVFSAKGGSVYYNLGDTQTQTLKDYLGDIAYGYSLKQWLEVFWMPALGYDPMGLIMVEVDEMDNAYPCYKSIMDVFEMKLRNRKVEYVIFKVAKKVGIASDGGVIDNGTIYRIVDDTTDRLVEVANGYLVDVPGETYTNYFLQVPACIISNIYNPVKGIFASIDDDIVELADQFLREGSVKNIYKNYFGFPMAWGYQADCPDCKGTKVIDGRPCDHCKGTGIRTKRDPSELLQLPVPQSKDEPILAPNVAGYVTPDVAGWDKMTAELELLEDIMFETLWGTRISDDAKSETATGRFIDVQPVNARLNKLSNAEEHVEKFVTDLIAGYMFRTAYKGCSVTAGRRYMIETQDKIWEKLTASIKNGAPMAALYDLYNDYLQARYSANAMEMQKMTKLAKIEPLPFVKYEELAKLLSFPDTILRRKFWFESWLNSKSDPDILFGDVKALQADFAAYCVLQDTDLNKQVQLNPAINGAGVPGEPAPDTPGAKPKPAEEPAAAA